MAKPFSFMLPCGASCSGIPSCISMWSFILWKLLFIASWHLMLRQLSCITLWSRMFWKPSYHCPMEPHDVSTPFVGLNPWIQEKSYNSTQVTPSIGLCHTHSLVQIHLSYEFKQHNLQFKQYFHYTSTTPFSLHYISFIIQTTLFPI